MISPDPLEHYTYGLHYKPRCEMWWNRYHNRVTRHTSAMFMYLPYLLVSN